jgi:hypothetical protein
VRNGFYECDTGNGSRTGVLQKKNPSNVWKTMRSYHFLVVLRKKGSAFSNGLKAEILTHVVRLAPQFPYVHVVTFVSR